MKWNAFATLYLKYSRENKKPKTFRNFDFPAVSSFRFDGELVDIGPLHIQSWRSTLHARGYNQNNIAILWGSLRAAFGYAVKLKILASNPMVGLPRPERSEVGRYLTDAEIGRLMGEAREPLRTAMVFALNVGLRISEIMGLDWRHVRDGVLVLPGKSRKNKKPTQMPLNAHALAVMGPPQVQGQVFHFAKRTVQDQLLQLSRRLGMGRVRFHDLRHTFVTNYLKHGSTRDLIEMSTHANENGLRGYNHPPNELLRSRMEMLASGPMDKRKEPQHAPNWDSCSMSSTYASIGQLVRRGGLEPPRVSPYAPQTYASKRFITWDGYQEDK